jgi:hypothetical protein
VCSTRVRILTDQQKAGASPNSLDKTVRHQRLTARAAAAILIFFAVGFGSVGVTSDIRWLSDKLSR